MININFKEYADNARKAAEEKGVSWKPKFNHDFLEHTLPILASIPLIKHDGLICPKETYLNLALHEVKTPNGIMSGTNIQELLKVIFWTNRGDLIHGSQIRNPRLGTLTPLPMYAQKLYNNVPYSAWAKTEGINIFLGRKLQDIVTVKEVPELSIEEIIELRKEALTFKSGIKEGEMDSLYNYKMNISHIKDISYPIIVRFMFLQTWLANASIRNTDSMILDPVNWDNIPTALDQQMQLPTIKPRKKIEKRKEKIVDEFPW